MFLVHPITFSFIFFAGIFRLHLNFNTIRRETLGTADLEEKPRQLINLQQRGTPAHGNKSF